MSEFQRNTIALPDHEMVYYTLGYPDNPPLVFINGGPGDNHHYLRNLAHHYADEFLCVLYDQRGCGESRLETYDAETLDLQRFLKDLDNLRETLGHYQINLFGHSWGALLATAYACFYPDNVQSAVLVGMGPLNNEMRQVAGANLLAPLTAEERVQYKRLKAQRKQAYADEDWERHAQIHQDMMARFNVQAWFYSRIMGHQFSQEFKDNYNYNPQLGQFVMSQFFEMDITQHLEQITAPILIIYGYQDFEPITQAYLFREKTPATELAFINEAGHVPWLEKINEFYKVTSDFWATYGS